MWRGLARRLRACRMPHAGCRRMPACRGGVGAWRPLALAGARHGPPAQHGTQCQWPVQLLCTVPTSSRPAAARIVCRIDYRTHVSCISVFTHCCVLGAGMWQSGNSYTKLKILVLGILRTAVVKDSNTRTFGSGTACMWVGIPRNKKGIPIDTR